MKTIFNWSAWALSIGLITVSGAASFAQTCEGGQSDVLTFAGHASELTKVVPANQIFSQGLPRGLTLAIENRSNSSFTLQEGDQLVYESSQKSVDESKYIYKLERQLMAGGMGTDMYPEGKGLEYGQPFYAFVGYSSQPTTESCETGRSIIGLGVMAVSGSLTGRVSGPIPTYTECEGERSTAIHPETNIHTFTLANNSDVQIKVTCGMDCTSKAAINAIASLFSKNNKIEGIDGIVLWAKRPFEHSCENLTSSFTEIKAIN